MNHNSNITTAMKIAIFLIVSLFAIVPITPAQENTGNTARVFLLDDQSGEELARDHGIQPIEISDLLVVVNGVLTNRKAVQVIHQVVDEDTSDNPLTTLDFKVYQGGAAPAAPPSGLPISQLREAMGKYRVLQRKWRRDIKAYQTTLQADVEDFVTGITAAQTAVIARHDAILYSNQGKDFNRSDISGAILGASKSLGPVGLRVLVLNTDAVDRPGKGKTRTAPFIEEELNPGVIIIWVNTSRIPDKSPLFQGLQNPTRHAKSMREAMEIVNSLLSDDPEVRAPKEDDSPP